MICNLATDWNQFVLVSLAHRCVFLVQVSLATYDSIRYSHICFPIEVDHINIWYLSRPSFTGMQSWKSSMCSSLGLGKLPGYEPGHEQKSLRYSFRDQSDHRTRILKETFPYWWVHHPWCWAQFWCSLTTQSHYSLQTSKFVVIMVFRAILFPIYFSVSQALRIASTKAVQSRFFYKRKESLRI